MTDRAQAFTLEAVLAAIVLLGSIIFALHVAGITPNTPSTADESIESQNRGLAEGALDAATADGSLEEMLLYWNTSVGSFHGAGEGYYVSPGPPTGFGETLNRTFDGYNVKYNVNVYYATENGSIDRQRIVHQGTPSDHAHRATTTVTLHGDERLVDATGNRSDVTVAGTTEFYAPDAGDGSVYNVLRVEVIVWRS